jgi:hypothetical protein
MKNEGILNTQNFIKRGSIIIYFPLIPPFYGN